MKKLLVLMLVLGIASLASATVIDVVLDGNAGVGTVGDMGHKGTISDPLADGETIFVKLVLNPDPGSYTGGAYPSYDGYVLSAMDLTLTAGSEGTMAVGTYNGARGAAIQYSSDWTLAGTPTIASNVLDTDAFASTAATVGGKTTGIDTWDGSAQVVTDLMWSIAIKADNKGDIDLTWGMATTPGAYYPWVEDKWGGAVPPATSLVSGDLGGTLTIYAVPEPMTIALLGLGGLFLRRRK